MTLERGTHLGSYEILALLGSGGMGDVYRAKDRRLGRDVAIKVLELEPGVGSETERHKRFEQEARAASALNHPNIVTIYDIGEHEGTPFIAMEYVEGRTLRELLAEGPLAPETILHVAKQIAEGLSKAHEAGIVHRDLKPENIMVTGDGYVKILDFGLAKLRPDPSRIDSEMATLEKLETEEGVVVGTVAYMSPEQARGEPVDFHTDQFSLGAILYEMATGKRPFDGSNSTQTLAAILERDPEPIRRQNPSVPSPLATIVERCLSKAPPGRYDSTGELARQFQEIETSTRRPTGSEARRKRWPALTAVLLALLVLAAIWVMDPFGAATPDPTDRVMLAVLPFALVSPDPDEEYISDGLTHEVIGQLGGLAPERLGVIARTSSMKYKNTDKSVGQIGRELGVDYLLEGSVRSDPPRVRVSAQLIDVTDQSQLLTETYERELGDLLALERDIARAIARTIGIAITPDEGEGSSTARRIENEAYEDYLRGRYHLQTLSEEAIRAAMAAFESALANEPDYAPAYAGLAQCYVLLGTVLVGSPPAELRPKAIAAARKALVLDDELAVAHAALGQVSLHEWQWTESEQALERALELNPSLAEAHQYHALYLASQRRFEEAIAAIRRAVKLDPLSVTNQAGLGFVLHLAGRHAEGARELRTALEMDPGFVWARWVLGYTYWARSRLEEALASFERAGALSDRRPAILGSLGQAYARLGREEDARRLLRELLDLSERQYVSPIAIARVYVGLDAKDEAFRWLDQAAEERSTALIYAQSLSWLEPLRSDPRFDELLRRIGLAR